MVEPPVAVLLGGGGRGLLATRNRRRGVGAAAVVSELLDEVHHHLCLGLGHRVRLLLRSLRHHRLFARRIGRRFGAGLASPCF